VQYPKNYKKIYKKLYQVLLKALIHQKNRYDISCTGLEKMFINLQTKILFQIFIYIEKSNSSINLWHTIYMHISKKNMDENEHEGPFNSTLRH